jgi:hypothetical protein
MERPRDPLELVIVLREEMAEVRTTMTHFSVDLSEVKQDLRRLDDRIFQVMLLQVGTLATALASLVAALVS